MLDFIPKITKSCIDVVAEGNDSTEYFISKIDILVQEQPVLFQKLIDSAHSIAIQVDDDTESDSYIFVFTNILAVAVQTYMTIDKQIGINFMEQTYGSIGVNNE